MPDFEKTNPALDEKWLGRAAWWVNHRDQMWKFFVVAVLVVDGALLLYSAYGWTDYLLLSRAQETQLYASLTSSTNASALHDVLAPKPISVPVVVVLPAGGQDGRYDVLAKFVNANPKWIATMRYRVVTTDKSTLEQKLTLLNDEEQFIVAGGVASSPSETARIEVIETTWMRLKNPAELNIRKPQLVVSDVQYLTATELKLPDPDLSQVRFSVKNDSINGFWAVHFVVVLMQGDSAVAARTMTLDNVASGASREGTINFYGALPSVTNVLVVPSVNVSDDSVFMNPPSQPLNF